MPNQFHPQSEMDDVYEKLQQKLVRTYNLFGAQAGHQITIVSDDEEELQSEGTQPEDAQGEF